MVTISTQKKRQVAVGAIAVDWDGSRFWIDVPGNRGPYGVGDVEEALRQLEKELRKLEEPGDE